MEKLHIIKAENAGNLTVYLTFSDNTTQTVDIGDFIRRHPPLRRVFGGFAIMGGRKIALSSLPDC